jgi:hypothetical protein
MAHDVFISSAAEDGTVANALRATLEAQRIRCWIAPRHVLRGVSYPEAPVDAISDRSLMVLGATRVQTTRCQIMTEVERAAISAVRIVLFQDIALSTPLERHTGTVRWFDVSTPERLLRRRDRGETTRREYRGHG